MPACCGSGKSGKISPELLTLIDTAFEKIDKDNSGEVDHGEAIKMFGRFGKVAAKEMLETMDLNHDKMLQKEEWREYFSRVRWCNKGGKAGVFFEGIRSMKSNGEI